MQEPALHSTEADNLFPQTCLNYSPTFFKLFSPRKQIHREFHVFSIYTLYYITYREKAVHKKLLQNCCFKCKTLDSWIQAKWSQLLDRNYTPQKKLKEMSLKCGIAKKGFQIFT